MRKNKQPEKSSDPAASRRNVLKAVAAGGGVMGLNALPSDWAKPVVSSVLLPAHGQSSPAESASGGCPGTIGNCENLLVYPIPTESDGTCDADDILDFLSNSVGWSPDISVDNDTTLNGSDQTRFVLVDDFGGGDASDCCTNAQKYFEGSVSFGGGNFDVSWRFGVTCGDDGEQTVKYCQADIEGSNGDGSPGYKYDCDEDKYCVVCTDLFS